MKVLSFTIIKRSKKSGVSLHLLQIPKSNQSRITQWKFSHLPSSFIIYVRVYKKIKNQLFWPPIDALTFQARLSVCFSWRSLSAMEILLWLLSNPSFTRSDSSVTFRSLEPSTLAFAILLAHWLQHTFLTHLATCLLFHWWSGRRVTCTLLLPGTEFLGAGGGKFRGDTEGDREDLRPRPRPLSMFLRLRRAGSGSSFFGIRTLRLSTNSGFIAGGMISAEVSWPADSGEEWPEETALTLPDDGAVELTEKRTSEISEIIRLYSLLKEVLGRTFGGSFSLVRETAPRLRWSWKGKAQRPERQPMVLNTERTPQNTQLLFWV